jgi:5,10-methylenetetrahydromethanopterin reductase
MEYDVLLLGKYPPDQLLHIARLVEVSGYGYLWYADEKFFRDPYVSLAYVALHTRRIKVGICVTDPYSRHPAITAMAAATLAEMAPGRFGLGIGAGFSGLHSLGLRQTKPVTATREAIQLMRWLWAGERVDVQGEVISFLDGQLEFKPPGHHIPVTMAATGRKMLELAGEMADGIIIGDYASASTLGKAMEHVRRGSDYSSRSLQDLHIAARVNVIMCEDRRLGLDMIKPWIAVSLWFTHPRWDYFLDYSPAWEDHFAPLKTFIEARGDKPRNVGDYALVDPYIHLVTDEMVYHRHMVGSAEEIAAQICSLPPVGINRVTIYPVPTEGQTEISVIQAFADQVVPRVQAKLAESNSSV